MKFALDDAQKEAHGQGAHGCPQAECGSRQDFLEQLEDQKGKADFAAVAAQAKLPVQETAEFEADQTTGIPEAAIPGFVEAAFKLVPGDPNSDVPLQTPSVQMPDAYYDLHLAGVTPQRQLTLDEARPKIIAAIKETRAHDAPDGESREIRAKLADALKSGRSFADAAKAAGQTPQEVPAFSAMEPGRGMRTRRRSRTRARILPAVS